MTANLRSILALAALVASTAFQAGAAPTAAQRDAARRDAGDLGCTVCHRQATPPRTDAGAPPLAPSFDDIAARYRGKPGAEARLTRVVLQGEGPGERHWKDRLEFTSMGANAPRVSEARARKLVRWILSTP